MKEEILEKAKIENLRIKIYLTIIEYKITKTMKITENLKICMMSKLTIKTFVK